MKQPYYQGRKLSTSQYGAVEYYDTDDFRGFPVLRFPLQTGKFQREQHTLPQSTPPGQSFCSARSRTGDGDSPPIPPLPCRSDRQQSCTTPVTCSRKGPWLSETCPNPSVKTKKSRTNFHCRGCSSDTEPLERIINSIVND